MYSSFSPPCSFSYYEFKYDCKTFITKDDFLCIEWIWKDITLCSLISPYKCSHYTLSSLENKIVQHSQDWIFQRDMCLRIDEKNNDVTTLQSLRKEIIKMTKAWFSSKKLKYNIFLYCPIMTQLKRHELCRGSVKIKPRSTQKKK